MSVEAVQRKGGKVWRVRWRDECGNARTQVLGAKRDAEAFDADIKRRKRLGELAQLDAGRQTVADFASGEWWEQHAKVNLTEPTRKTYAAMFDRHLLPRVGSMRLRDVTPAVVARLRSDLAASGVGDSAARKALFLLQGIFACAIEWGHLTTTTNPVASVRKPSGRRKRTVVALPPTMIEAMRNELRIRGDMRDATLVSLLAYSGLRPGEALALRWGDVTDRTLRVERAVANGVVKTTKTGEVRTVRLLGPLVADLREWRLASGQPDAGSLVFPAFDGEPWRTHGWKNWSRRTWKPLAERHGTARSRPYDLRHSFCSLLLHEGRNPIEVAAQAGHQPSMTLDTYGHVIAELEGSDRVPAEDAIMAARRAHVSEKCPPDAQSIAG